MPPKKEKEKETKQRRKAATPAAAAVPLLPPKSAAYEGADDAFFLKGIGTMQAVQQSVANHGAAKKFFLERLKEDPDEVLVALRHLVIGVLKQAPSISLEALRRHNSFYRELCKAMKDVLKSDRMAVSLLESLIPYGKATNKAVRLHVVCNFDELLRTLDPSVESDERQTFYDNATQMLKQRMYDTCPHVRERAVAAISSFQGGTKDDDVTCHLVSALIEDTSAEVRRQVLRGIQSGNGSKEFLHVYFAAMMRSTRDAVAKVREAAWEALHRFKWSHINHYCKRENIDVLHHVALGLEDASTTCRTACRLTVTKSWLQRDAKDDPTVFLDATSSAEFRGAMEINLPSAERVAKELLTFLRKAHPTVRDDKRFKLRLIKEEHGGMGITFGNVLVWKARCEEITYRGADDAEDVAADVEDSEANSVMLPLPVLHDVIQDVTMLFAKPDQYTPKLITLQGSEVEEVLRLLLAALQVYSDGGFLAHTDNNTRTALLKQLGFLLKVVPDTDPGLFVEPCVASIRLLTARHAEEASTVVNDALNLLFSGVQVRKEHGLTFEDIETLGKLDAERRAKLTDLKRRYTGQDEEAVQLQEQISFDQKFLLRMQHIVLAFLSNAARLERVPPFCSFVVQLGRHQCDPEVKVLATRSLALLCLINPETVHTFFPVLVQDASAGNGMYAHAASPPTDTATAALTALFDIVCEYGLKFFNVGDAPSKPNAPRSAEEPSGADDESFVVEDEDPEAARLRAEQAAAAESIHRRGGAKALRQLMGFLTSKHFSQRQVAMVGFCKLLSCNRIPTERIPHILAQLLAHNVVEPTTKKGSSVVPHHVSTLVHTFLSSYSASSSMRQGFIAEGGILAYRLLLHKLPSALSVAQRTMMQVVRLTDAASLKQVRDADPEFAQQVATEYRDEAAAAAAAAAANSGAGGLDGSGEGGDGNEGKHRKSRGVNAAVLSKQIGHLRLRHELSRQSLHEYVAMELLTDIAANPMSTVSVRAAMQALPKLRFYCTQPSCTQRLLEHCAAAMAALPHDEEDANEKLAAMLEALKTAHADAVAYAHERDTSALHDAETMPRRLMSVEERTAARSAFVASLDSADTNTEGDDEASYLEACARSYEHLGFSQQAHTAQAVLAATQTQNESKASRAGTPAPKPKRTVSQRTATQQQRPRAEEEIDMDDIVGGRGAKRARK